MVPWLSRTSSALVLLNPPRNAVAVHGTHGGQGFEYHQVQSALQKIELGFAHFHSCGVTTSVCHRSYVGLPQEGVKKARPSLLPGQGRGITLRRLESSRPAFGP